MEIHEKLCPVCHCSYRPVAERCADCDVDLVWPSELAGAEAPVEALPPASELVPIRVATTAWCRGFSALLSERGIAHRIDAPPDAARSDPSLRRRSHDTGVAVYVRPEDRDSAVQADADFVRSQIPDLEDAPDGAAEGASPDEDGCPACGAQVAPEGESCPDCGLFLGG